MNYLLTPVSSYTEGKEHEVEVPVYIIGTCTKLGSSNHLQCIYLIWLEPFVLVCHLILWCQIIISANRGSEENETSHSCILLIKLFYNLMFIREYLGLFPVLVDQRCNIAVLENSWLTAFISASSESSCMTVITSLVSLACFKPSFSTVF